MSFLRKFLQFSIFEEMIPVKNESYVRRTIWFRKALLNAQHLHDGKTVWQFRCLFLFLAAFIVHHVYLYRVELNEFESYVEIDLVRWIGLPNEINISFSLLALVTLYCLHVFYFSPLTGPMFRTMEEILAGGRLSVEHWPFHYKHQQCSQVARRCLFQNLNAFQIAVIVLGKYTFSKRDLFFLLLFLQRHSCC